MKIKTFRGGYKVKEFKGQPEARLVDLGLPPEVVIPLSQGFGIPLQPSVEVGDRVVAGQIVASDSRNVSSPIHSSVNGKVIEIGRMNYFKREVNKIVVNTEEGDSITKLEGYSDRWEKLPAEVIEDLLYKSGVTSLDREGIPTRFRSSIISPEDVEDLIIHGAGSEFYNISLDVFLGGKNLYNFVEGIKILKKVMPKTKIHLAINKNERKILERIKNLTTNIGNFTIYQVPPKYPQGYDEVLVPTLLGKKFPYGYSAANIGIVVLNIQAVTKVYEAVVKGNPLIERVIALCGPSFKENLHLKVKVGTPLKYLLKGRLKQGSHRIILNSLLTGYWLNDLSLPVDRTFSQIIAIPEDNQRKLFAFLRAGRNIDSYSRAFVSAIARKGNIPTTNLRGDQRPCIQCGYCLEICPVRIMPAMIDRYIKLGINEILMRYGIFNCIECNLCTYVCPSKISLGQNLKDAKVKLIEIGCDQSLCILPKFNLRGLEQYKGVKKLR